ncbi:hypothetical protein JCM15519_03330 [Fundidesulfovibrio butyratiphilus]
MLRGQISMHIPSKNQGKEPDTKENNMAFDPKELRGKLSSLSAQMRDLVENTPPEKWGPAHAKKFDAMEREHKAVGDALDRYQALLDKIADERGASDFSGSYSPDFYDGGSMRDALKDYVIRGDASGFGFSNALTEGADSGGVLVPFELSREIMAIAKKYSPLRDLARVVQIKTTASRFAQPVIVSGAGSGWVGEEDARPATTVPKIDGVEFADAEIYANLPVTAWLDEDTQAGAVIVAEIGKAFGRQEGEAFISGTGVKQPLGILTSPATAEADDVRAFGTVQYIHSGAESTITPDGLIALLYRLLPECRSNAAWIMNSTTIATVRKLKDNNGNYLWSDGLSAGQPPMLLGVKVVEANNMPDIAANAFPIAVADWKSAYTIVDRSMSLLRDPFTNKPYVNIYAKKRVSGAIVDSCAIKLLKIAA